MDYMIVEVSKGDTSMVSGGHVLRTLVLVPASACAAIAAVFLFGPSALEPRATWTTN